MFEKCVKYQLSRFAELRLGHQQFGFRRHLHCEAVLLNVSDHILNALDEKEQAVLILLDFSKAFDSVDHVLLLRMLESLGLHMHLFDLLRIF